MKVFLNLLAESPCPKALAKLTCNFIPTCDFIPSFHFHRSFGMKLQKYGRKRSSKKKETRMIAEEEKDLWLSLILLINIQFT